MKGRVVIVTGAASGIGAAVSRVIAESGAIVGGIDIDRDGLANLARDFPRMIPVCADVGKREEIQAAVATIGQQAGHIDGLVNNAMVSQRSLIRELEPDVMRRMISIGIEGSIWATQAALDFMEATRSPAIVNMSSVLGLRAAAGGAMYATIKAALLGFTRAAAVELGPSQVRVNAVAPGPVRTEGSDKKIDADGWAKRVNTTPMGRLATSEDVARLVAYLLSQDSSPLSGETIVLDGARNASAP